MIATHTRLPNGKRFILVVLSRENVRRLQQADPVTLQNLPGCDDVELFIASEPDADTLTKRFPDSAALIRYLCRGMMLTKDDVATAERMTYGPTEDEAKDFLRERGYTYADMDKHPALLVEFAAKYVRAASFDLKLAGRTFDLAMNSIVAPVTLAWQEFAIEQIVIDAKTIQEDFAKFTCVLSAKRRKDEGTRVAEPVSEAGQ